MARQKPQKRNPNAPKGTATSNAAKARRVEKHQTERKTELRDLGGMLQQFGDGIKKAVEKRQAEAAFKRFSMPMEDQAAHSFSIPASLIKPEQMIRHGDRIQWYWDVSGIAVIATLIMQDSPVLSDQGIGHGLMAGEWLVDAVGPSGTALFQMTADVAKDVAEAMLSAVNWRFAYLEYMPEYIGEFDEVDEAEVIQVYDKMIDPDD